MALIALCGSCQPHVLEGLGHIPPTHCYGTGDEPAPPGVMGGFYCSCSCRADFGSLKEWAVAVLSEERASVVVALVEEVERLRGQAMTSYYEHQAQKGIDALAAKAEAGKGLYDALKALVVSQWEHRCSDGVGGCTAVSGAALEDIDALARWETADSQ